MPTDPRVVHVRDKVPGAVYIGRAMPRQRLTGSPFANPYKIGGADALTREMAIAHFRAWLLGQPALVERAKRELRGKVLACWCAPEACHGDVLLEVANAD